MIQDEVLGFHWNNSQCTLHPVVTYYQVNDELKNIFCCLISDDRKHVALVYQIQKSILADLKCKSLGYQLLFALLMGVLDGTKIKKIFIIFVSTRVILDWMWDRYSSSATEVINLKQVRKQDWSQHMKKKGMLEDITDISLVTQVWNESVVFLKKLRSILQQMDQKNKKLCSTLLAWNL